MAFESCCGRRWLIPDLIGHGDSDVSADTWAYKMESQAAAVLEMLRREGTKRCSIVAHSMGGPVAVSLVELCAEAGIGVDLLFYCEGNLDKGDCFHALALARNVVHKELWSPDLIHRRAAVLFWSAAWLIKESSSGSLLPRLAALARPSQSEADCAKQVRGAVLSLPSPSPPAHGGGTSSTSCVLDVRFIYGDKRRSDNGYIPPSTTDPNPGP